MCNCKTERESEGVFMCVCVCVCVCVLFVILKCSLLPANWKWGAIELITNIIIVF